MNFSKSVLSTLISATIFSTFTLSTAQAAGENFLSADASPLANLEERRSRGYSQYLTDHQGTWGLSVRRLYQFLGQNAPQKSGWKIWREGYSSLQRYTITSESGANSQPFLQDLPVGEYIIIQKESGGGSYRFVLKGSTWVAVDNWLGNSTLEWEEFASGGGHWGWMEPQGAVSIFNAQGQITDRFASVHRYTFHHDSNGLLTRIQNERGDGALDFTYDDSGNIASFSNYRDETTYYRYDAEGRLAAVLWPDATASLSDNPATRYQYDDSSKPNLLTSVVSPLGYNVFSSYYDSDTSELVYKDLDDARADNRPTMGDIKQSNGTIYQSKYWSNGLQIHYINSEVSAVTSNGEMVDSTEIAAARQEAEESGYRLERSTYRLENSSCVECLIEQEAIYSDDGLRHVKRRYANGLATEATSLIGSDGRDISKTYRESRHGQLIKLVTFEGDTPENTIIRSEETATTRSTYGYNNVGLRIEETLVDTTSSDAVPHTTRHDYQGGLLKSIDGPRTDVEDITTFAYDDRGNLIRATNALGQSEYFEYDQHDRRIAVTDYNDVRTVLEYGIGEQVLSVTRAANSDRPVTTQYHYDGEGNLTDVSLSGGYSIHRKYDAHGRVKSLSDVDGNWVDYRYNDQGRLVGQAVYDQAAQQMVQQEKWAWDHLNRLTKVGETNYHYQNQGNNRSQPEDIVTGNGDRTRLSYDRFDRVVSSVDTLGGENQYEYDAQGNIARVIDARGVTTQFDYDGLGRRIAEHSASKGTVTYQYDEAGNVVRETRENGIVIRRRFDALNRLTRVVFKQRGQDRKRFKYEYDNCNNGIGRLCQVSGAGSTTRYDYDLHGNYSSIKTRLRGEATANVTKYAYNDHNQLTDLIYPSGLKVSYHYSANGTVVKVTANQAGKEYTVVESVKYRPLQAGFAEITFGNGLTTELNYNQQGQLERLVTGSVQDLIYQYDANGNIVNIDRPLRDGWQQLFEYDGLNRLVGESRSGKIISYEYDSVGNRLTRTAQNSEEDAANVKTYSYAKEANRLDKINKQELIYDPNGNLIEDKNGKRRFQYDVTNRLTNYFKNGEHKASYTYNAFEQRIKKTIRRPGAIGDDHKSLTFTYLPSGWLLSEDGRDVQDQKGWTRDYIWLGNKPIAQIRSKFKLNGEIKSQTISYIHTDHLNTPRVATDADQNIVWRWDSNAFGEQRAQRDPDQNGERVTISLRFPGQYYDNESKLYYNHHRDYDPRIGRYIQSDPIGLGGGVNRYAYVENNPIRSIDRLGLSPQPPYIDGPHSRPTLLDRASEWLLKDGIKRLGSSLTGIPKSFFTANPYALAAYGLLYSPPLACGELDCDGDGYDDYTGELLPWNDPFDDYYEGGCDDEYGCY